RRPRLQVVRRDLDFSPGRLRRAARPPGRRVLLPPAPGRRVPPPQPGSPAGAIHFQSDRQGRHSRLFPAAPETARRATPGAPPRRGAEMAGTSRGGRALRKSAPRGHSDRMVDSVRRPGATVGLKAVPPSLVSNAITSMHRSAVTLLLAALGCAV